MPSSLTRAQARDLARLIAQDTNTTDPGVSDTKANALLEEQRQWYASIFQEDTVGLAYSEANPAVTGALTLTPSLGVFRSLDTCFSTFTGDVYDRVDYHVLVQRRQYDLVNTVPATSIRTWAAIRTADNTWSVLFHPTAAVAQSIRIYGHYEVEPLTADGDAMLFGNHGSRVVARLAAIEIARSCGRPPEFLAAIAAQLPERVVTRRADLERMLGPQAMRT